MSPDAKPSGAPAPVWPAFVAFAVVVIVMQVVGGAVAVGALAAKLASEPNFFGRLATTDFASLMLELVATPGAVVASVVASESVLLAACAIVVKATQATAREALHTGPARTTLLALPAILVGPLALSQAMESAITLLGGMRWTLSLRMFGYALTHASWPVFAVLAALIGLAAPLAEEMFFRGFVQTRLRRRWSARWAIVITAALFGLMHMDPVHTPCAFVIGLGLGWIAELTGSIRPAIAAHAVNNVTSVVIGRVLPGEVPKATHVALLLAAIAVALGAWWVLRKAAPAEAPAAA